MRVSASLSLSLCCSSVSCLHSFAARRPSVQCYTYRSVHFVFKMKVVAAYLLALLGGNASPSAEDIKSILGSVGAEADDDRISFLLKELEGKDILEVIASGKEKFASVPSGGGGGSGVVVSSGGGGGAAAAPAEEAKEEKKEEEAKEESDDDMGFSLFD